MPTKIIAVGVNYLDHAREMGRELPKEPLIWFKATTSLLPDGGKIEIPFREHRTDFEAELCIVIGRRIRNVTPAAAARRWELMLKETVLTERLRDRQGV